ncbi:hypothetical protein WOLCODRAFT_153334 [Wolfiporia cocos MD-104 SS10]|uniref:peptide-methionine (S)-S-oxide reductase n=1 Tax=Wolfiporia cocos (strain MD-104) TaxID=742152 RepID=A0A2H3JM67_WOLCO|nr:hypothetical protein WOLCODRAFT_153334 [Wolfiporia cocos MD-104 SS10]
MIKREQEGHAASASPLSHNTKHTLDDHASRRSRCSSRVPVPFWGVEHIFLKHYPITQSKGILCTTVGYTSGDPDVKDPDYPSAPRSTITRKSPCVEFDPPCRARQRAQFLYMTHDPTTPNP